VGDALVKAALVTLAKALGQLLDAYYVSYDRETSELMAALAAWVAKNDECKS
jgi:hypothetical protein